MILVTTDEGQSRMGQYQLVATTLTSQQTLVGLPDGCIISIWDGHMSSWQHITKGHLVSQTMTIIWQQIYRYIYTH